jgi:hypothetical protein
MAHGDLKKRTTPKAGGLFIEYKIQPGDTSLKQIARNQLADESLWDKIVLNRETPNPATNNYWDEIPAGAWDPRWVLLLPPSIYAAFIITVKTTICKNPNGALLGEAKVGEKFFYKRSSVSRSADKKVVWVDATSTSPARYNGSPYWVCVKNGNPLTNPPIESPS